MVNAYPHVNFDYYHINTCIDLCPSFPRLRKLPGFRVHNGMCIVFLKKGVKLKFSASTKGSEMRKFQGFPIVAHHLIPYSEHTLGYDHLSSFRSRGWDTSPTHFPYWEEAPKVSWGPHFRAETRNLHLASPASVARLAPRSKEERRCSNTSSVSCSVGVSSSSGPALWTHTSPWGVRWRASVPWFSSQD